MRPRAPPGAHSTRSPSTARFSENPHAPGDAPNSSRRSTAQSSLPVAASNAASLPVGFMWKTAPSLAVGLVRAPGVEPRQLLPFAVFHRSVPPRSRHRTYSAAPKSPAVKILPPATDTPA